MQKSIAIAIVVWLNVLTLQSQDQQVKRIMNQDRTQEQQMASNPEKIQGNNSYRIESLSMRDCLLRAIKHNLDIEIEGFNPKLKEWDVTDAKSAFDPTFTSSFTYGVSDQQPTSLSTPRAFVTNTIEVGFQKRHQLGGSLGVFYTMDYSDPEGGIATTSWQHGVSLRVTQSLLRNLGIDTNLTQIRIAQTNLDSSYYAFSQKLLTVITQVQTAYWDLVNTRENYELQRKSLDLAENFYKITQERIKVGSLAAAEILDAERDVAFKQDNLVVAEKNIYAAEDRLKNLIRPLDLSYYKDVRIIPTENPLFQGIETDLEQALQYALEHRPDIQQSKLGLQNLTYRVDYQKNLLLPKLDFSASLGLEGTDSSGTKAWEYVIDGEFPRWQVGLSLEIPLGNRSAHSEYQKVVLQREQLTSQHRSLENSIVLEIRQAIRDLRTASIRATTAKRSRELAEKQLVNEENKFRAGLIALFQVQDTEKKLTEARINEVTTQLDYQRALVLLDKVRGALAESLKRYGIELEEIVEKQNR